MLQLTHLDVHSLLANYSKLLRQLVAFSCFVQPLACFFLQDSVQMTVEDSQKVYRHMWKRPINLQAIEEILTQKQSRASQTLAKKVANF